MHPLDLLNFSATPNSAITGLVLLRVYAYYGRNKRLFWVLSSLWGLAFCVTVAELIVLVHQVMRTFSHNLYHTPY